MRATDRFLIRDCKLTICKMCDVHLSQRAIKASADFLCKVSRICSGEYHKGCFFAHLCNRCYLFVNLHAKVGISRYIKQELLYKNYFSFPDLFVALLYETTFFYMVCGVVVPLYNNGFVCGTGTHEGSTPYRLSKPGGLCFSL